MLSGSLIEYIVYKLVGCHNRAYVNKKQSMPCIQLGCHLSIAEYFSKETVLIYILTQTSFPKQPGTTQQEVKIK